MAPRKQRQMGLTRMDAVLDQLSCFGFSRRLISQTVRNLLKLYGEDGWKLIEEDGYKVVLDVILDEQESAILTQAESSEQVNTGNDLVMEEGNKIASLTIHTGTENDECCKFTTTDKTAHSSTFHDDNSKDKINTQSSENAPRTTPLSDVGVGHTPVNVPPRTRKPCYGWISDIDDEETYFIILTTAR